MEGEEEAGKKEVQIFNKYLDEKVFIKTKSGRCYSGFCKEVSDCGNGLVFYFYNR